MKFLVISFFYPPAQNVAAERWFRLSQELKSQKHEVNVWTGPWKKFEQSSGITAINDPISEDAALMTAPPEKKDGVKKTFLRRMTQKTNVGFLLVDGKFFWSLKVFIKLVFLKNIRDQYDFLIVTGPPWSSVVLASAAAWLRGVPLIVDFRDPWFGEETVRYKGSFAQAYYRALEGWVVNRAQFVTTVASGIADKLKLHNSDKKFVIVESGFENDLEWSREDFNTVENRDHSILYAGSVTSYHGIEAFFDAAQPAIPKELRIRFLGIDHTGEVKKRYFCDQEQRVQSDEAEKRIRRAGVLLVTVAPEKAEIFVGGKLMTYMKCGRPILYFGPIQTPAAEMIGTNGLGWVVDSSKPELLAPILQKIQKHFETGTAFDFNPDRVNIDKYSAKSIVTRFVQILRA